MSWSVAYVILLRQGVPVACNWSIIVPHTPASYIYNGLDLNYIATPETQVCIRKYQDLLK